jgi:hypothetical protein
MFFLYHLLRAQELYDALTENYRNTMNLEKAKQIADLVNEINSEQDKIKTCDRVLEAKNLHEENYSKYNPAPKFQIASDLYIRGDGNSSASFKNCFPYEVIMKVVSEFKIDAQLKLAELEQKLKSM